MSKLWYQEPAKIWEEALPLGNGRLGAMIFGGVDRERIQVNEESVWYGGPTDRHNPDAKEALDKVRKLVAEGKTSEAERCMGLSMTACPAGARPYQTLGDIEMWFGHSGAVSGYQRYLDLEQALCLTEYQAGETAYVRESFISKPANCMAMKMSSQGKDGISFQLKMGRGHYFDGIRKRGTDRIYLYGNLGAGGFCFGAMLRAKAQGGSCRVTGETLVVERAEQVTLYFAADTTYHQNWEGFSLEETYQALENLLDERLEKACAREYETLKEEHIRDYRSLYGRVGLELGTEPEANSESKEALSTKERLERVADGAQDIGLVKLLFDYGRYLLISSSREGDLPATLQGIWNKDFEPAWDSKYTININAEMNYWPAEVCALPECHKPLFDLLEKVRQNGRKTAEKMYGCRGFLAHHNTDIYGDSAPQDLWYPATYWTLGGAWLCTHLWTHYRYTMDEAFLEQAFPTLAEAALFFVDFLTPAGEYLVTNPSVSPENTYVLPSGEKGCCCMGPTMDNQILRDLFSICIDSYEILGERAKKAQVPGVSSIENLIAEIREKREKLAPTKIGSDGRIMEWLEEYGEDEPGHRHISHLYGLFPSDQISVDGTPQLAQAARKTLEYRLENGGGHTGWSRAWITNHYAKLWDGENACDSIQKMLIHSTYPNLFDKHPPFQIDGNFGVCAAIANMLVQSNADRVVLLPALPQKWQEGRVKGLRLSGNAGIEMEWQKGRLVFCRIWADSDYCAKVLYRGQECRVDLKAGEEKVLREFCS